ncbi:hypothetical protein PSHT_13673 [Puccinia striiformis]|uniref:Uncharacterized protein n=1 Tax=Puccinia striiformis TaxID=27350 RepID=A0A2S4UPF2_9BASI|nr:hypothetical protein PSHT_13673 [Puccinia striiformis]
MLRLSHLLITFYLLHQYGVSALPFSPGEALVKREIGSATSRCSHGHVLRKRMKFWQARAPSSTFWVGASPVKNANEEAFRALKIPDLNTAFHPAETASGVGLRDAHELSSMRGAEPREPTPITMTTEDKPPGSTDEQWRAGILKTMAQYPIKRFFQRFQRNPHDEAELAAAAKTDEDLAGGSGTEVHPRQVAPAAPDGHVREPGHGGDDRASKPLDPPEAPTAETPPTKAGSDLSIPSESTGEGVVRGSEPIDPAPLDNKTPEDVRAFLNDPEYYPSLLSIAEHRGLLEDPSRELYPAGQAAPAAAGKSEGRSGRSGAETPPRHGKLENPSFLGLNLPSSTYFQRSRVSKRFIWPTSISSVAAKPLDLPEAPAGGASNERPKDCKLADYSSLDIEIFPVQMDGGWRLTMGFQLITLLANWLEDERQRRRQLKQKELADERRLEDERNRQAPVGDTDQRGNPPPSDPSAPPGSTGEGELENSIPARFSKIHCPNLLIDKDPEIYNAVGSDDRARGAEQKQRDAEKKQRDADDAETQEKRLVEDQGGAKPMKLAPVTIKAEDRMPGFIDEEWHARVLKSMAEDPKGLFPRIPPIHGESELAGAGKTEDRAGGSVVEEGSGESHPETEAEKKERERLANEEAQREKRQRAAEEQFLAHSDEQNAKNDDARTAEERNIQAPVGNTNRQGNPPPRDGDVGGEHSGDHNEHQQSDTGSQEDKKKGETGGDEEGPTPPGSPRGKEIDLDEQRYHEKVLEFLNSREKEPTRLRKIWNTVSDQMKITWNKVVNVLLRRKSSINLDGLADKLLFKSVLYNPDEPRFHTVAIMGERPGGLLPRPAGLYQKNPYYYIPDLSVAEKKDLPK